MAVLTTLAVIGGAALLVGGAAAAGVYYATEDDRARARISQIDQEISNCNTIINSFSDLKSKLAEGKSYLSGAKTDFKSGGHVLDEIPLANSEFTSCISKIDSAIKNIDDIINRYNNDKNTLNNEKTKLQEKL